LLAADAGLESLSLFIIIRYSLPPLAVR